MSYKPWGSEEASDLVVEDLLSVDDKEMESLKLMPSLLQKAVVTSHTVGASFTGGFGASAKAGVKSMSRPLIDDDGAIVLETRKKSDIKQVFKDVGDDDAAFTRSIKLSSFKSPVGTRPRSAPGRGDSSDIQVPGDALLRSSFAKKYKLRCVCACVGVDTWIYNHSLTIRVLSSVRWMRTSRRMSTCATRRVVH
jgi:hypothetical protein